MPVIPLRKTSRTEKRCGAFTIVELLVVIAIIGILAASLFPFFSRARVRDRQTTCSSNLKRINAALVLYAHDYDEVMPVLDLKVPPINGGESEREPYDRQLKPYVRTDNVFVCPDDSGPRPDYRFPVWDGSYRNRDLKRSYSICNAITTQEGVDLSHDPDPNTGLSGHPLAQFEQPNDTLSFVENRALQPIFIEGIADNVLNSMLGSDLMGCDTWKLAGRKKPGNDPIDNFMPCNSSYTDPASYPTRGHFDMGNYAFIDGHTRALRWPQIRANDFHLFKLHKPTQVFTP